MNDRRAQCVEAIINMAYLGLFGQLQKRKQVNVTHRNYHRCACVELSKWKGCTIKACVLLSIGIS